MSTVQAAKPNEELSLGLAEIRVTNHPDSVLTTYVLGSGVAVTVYDPVARVGGMLHFLLPRWSICKKSAMENPATFADSGIPQLYRRCYKFGAEKERMVCYVAGGADVMDRTGSFGLGKDNVRAAIDVLKKNGVEITGEWTGGNEGRYVRLRISDGKFSVKTNLGDEFST